MRCPACGSENTLKVIASGLPMKICDDCKSLWGEPFATIYTYLIAPVEGMLNGGFVFFPYEGNYFKALWSWIIGDLD